MTGLSRDDAGAKVAAALAEARTALGIAEIASSTGEPESEVLAAAERLRRSGWDIEKHGRGLRLVARPPCVTAYDLWGEGGRFGALVYAFETVSSTNTLASLFASAGDPEGTVVIADRQTEGRGRHGRGWLSPPGVGVWMSVIVRPGCPPARAAGFSLAASVAVVRGARRACGVALRVKWPNDVMHDGKKVAGVLIESEGGEDVISHAVIGVGVNVNTDMFDEDLFGAATSLAIAAGRKVDRATVARAVLVELGAVYETFLDAGFASILDEWRRSSETLGRTVCVASGGEQFTGVAEDVDGDGALIVHTRTGRRRVISGSLWYPAG